MVIFGAGGDLTKRLLVPALYNLATTGLLPEHFELIGVDLADLDADKWRDSLHEMMESFVGKAASESRIDKVDEDTWKRLTGRITYIRGDLNDDGLYEKLKQHIDQKSDTGGNCLFYLAIADRFFGPVVTHLGKVGLFEENWDEYGRAPEHWRRVVIEKPFGHDEDSAKALNATILRCAEEHQIYRIDHFLGKETVQNIMALRFANGMFEPLWNRDRIDHVQITAAETVGVETRGRFYEKTGALRDMIPNHVFQLLAMVAMEPPGGFDARAVRGRKEDVFSAMRTVEPEDAVRGQYGPGPNGVPGYRQEKDVAPDSRRRNLCRDATGDRQLALGRGAVLPAHRQAHVPPRDRDRHPLQARARSRRSRTPTSPRCRPTGCCCKSSRTRASRCSSRSSGPARSSISPPCAWRSNTPTGSRRNRTLATRR